MGAAEIDRVQERVSGRAGEDQVLGVGAGRELSPDGRHDLRGERELTDAGVALGSRFEAAAEAAGLVTDVNHLDNRRGAVEADAAAAQPRQFAEPQAGAKQGQGVVPPEQGEAGEQLFHVVLDELVDSFVPTMDRIGERVEDLGEDVLAGRQVQNDVFALRRDLVTIRRGHGPMGDAMAVLLRRELGLFDEETRHYLQDIDDHLLRIAQTVEAYQDLAAGALEANLTVVSNKVNEVARTLTAYAAIFAALTLVSGVYGMNFEHMPELHWRLGYPLRPRADARPRGRAAGFFKRKGWL